MSEPKRDFTADSGPTSTSHQQVSQPPRQAAGASQSAKPASSFLTELDAPTFGRRSSRPPPSRALSDSSAVSGVREVDATNRESRAPVAHASDPALAISVEALTEDGAVPDSDAAALTDTTDSVLSPKSPSEPHVSTRSQTHVSEDMWLDRLLDLPLSEQDPRQRLAWRFKCAFSAWKMLLPVCSAQTARVQLQEEMRRYERLLRESGPALKRATDKQLSDALHLQLSDSKVVELERALSDLEALLFAADASISQEAFKARWNREHTDLRQLLRYARLLAGRRFGIGYRRDRFEALALELLTLKLPSGRLQLMPRRRASQVLRQLLRGLYRPSTSPDDNRQAVAYLRDALDRLDAIVDAQQFFDSGLYLDIYGYKISRHDRILCPEFLYLSVAIEVDVHNLLLSWSQVSAEETGKPLSLAPLQLQLRAQKEAAQAVFNDFHKPLAGSSGAPPRTSGVPLKTSGSPPRAIDSKRARSLPAAQTKAAPQSRTGRYVGAGLLLAAALAANLYVTGAVHLREPPHVLSQATMQSVSPLLVNAQLSADGKRLYGSVSRPSWLKLTPSERSRAAESIASELKRRGIDHAQLLAYKSRAVEIDFGSVVYLDDAPTLIRAPGR